MNRITPKQVLDAYKQTGLKPIDGEWLEKRVLNEDTDDGEWCCCPLTALYCAANPDPERVYEWNAGHIYIVDDVRKWADQEYGHDYSLGFYRGVDSDEGDDYVSPEFDEGFVDGCRAWGIVTTQLAVSP
jgi:hypothetical protein